MRSQKLMRIKSGLSDLVSKQSLINSLFQDIPELQIFSWSYSQEYDDSNYSDYSRLLSVNGHSVDYDGDYEEEEDEEEGEKTSASPNGRIKICADNLPKLEKEDVEIIMTVVHEIAPQYGYQDEFTVERPSDDDEVKPQAEERPFEKYLRSFISGSELPETFFVCDEEDEYGEKSSELAEIATYYAMDHGRFSPEIEFKIFAKEGMMFRAFRYAQHVIGGSLPEGLENFFILKDDAQDEDHQWLVKYLSFRKNKEQKVKKVKKTRKDGA